MLRRRFVWLITVLMIVIPGLAACQPAASNPNITSYSAIVHPYRFDFGAWELAAFLGPNNPFTRYPAADVYDTAPVRRYLGIVAQEIELNNTILAQVSRGGTPDQAQTQKLAELRSERVSLEPQVERIVAAQVTMVLHENGIFTPLDRFIHIGRTLPRIWFKLDELPHLLVISPRDKIESIYEANLFQELDAKTINTIEDQVAGVPDSSGLVVMLGGIGFTYPTFVANETDLDYLMHTVAEEWLHQYLAFTPLGIRYVLDLTHIKDDYTLATMNETAASMVAEEIAQKTVARFYQQPQVFTTAGTAQSTAFDFNAEMRQIRLHVDELLAKGQVNEAEAYMDERRVYLEQHGYYIRKLNQAYFAFYGTYANEPTSVDPIGVAMRTLRREQPDLHTFLDKVVTLKSKEQLFNIISAN